MAMKSNCRLLCSIVLLSILWVGNARSQIVVLPSQDTTSVMTQVVQAAIDSCHRQGGGTVEFKKGIYLIGTIHLRSFVHIILEKGVRLKGSIQKKDYPDENLPHLIYGVGLEKVAISGQGTIEGQSDIYFDKSTNHWTAPHWRPLRWLYISNSKDIHIRDISLRDSPSHTLVLESCTNAVVDGIIIRNHLRTPNTDGIDITGGKNITIRNVDIYTGDDGICLKASKDPIDGIYVHHCKIVSDDAALKFGTGSVSHIINGTFENIDIRDSRYGITLFMTQGGLYKNAIFRNISIHNNALHRFEYPMIIDITPRSNQYSCGKIENIIFENIHIQTRGSILINGQDDSYISNVSFKNISVELWDILDLPTRVTKKPTGNKDFNPDPKWLDLSKQNAHLVMGKVRNMSFDNFYYKYDSKDIKHKDNRSLIYTIDAEAHGLQNIKIIND